MKAPKLVLRLAVFAAASSSLGAFATPLDDQVPFRGHLAGTSTFVGFGAPPSPPFPALPPVLPRIDVDLSGNFLHMGNSTASLTFWFLPTNPAQTEGYTFGISTVTSANGDTVAIIAAGFSQPAPGGRVQSGSFFVVGGTGRFAGATGGGTYVGHQVGVLAAPGDSAPVTVDLDGTISRPKGG